MAESRRERSSLTRGPSERGEADDAILFRVGVTGTRDLPEDSETCVREGVVAVLTSIRTCVLRAASARGSTLAHAGIELQLVSPLAEGADRLVACEALKLGYSLVAPLPFRQAEYEKDFDLSVDAFRGLLAQSKIVELDGRRGPDEAESYEAVGLHVVANCDLLLAVWDGETTGKRGGTAEITKFAVKDAVPVWWISLDCSRSPRWLEDERQWARRFATKGHVRPMETLEAYVTHIVSSRGRKTS